MWKTMRSQHSLLLAGLGLSYLLASGCVGDADSPIETTGSALVCNAAEGEVVFQELIQPLYADDSCGDCHDGETVNLGMWDMGSPCQTMACMAEKQLIDFDDIDESRVLEFIMFGMPEGGGDIRVEREYDNFFEWIQWGQTCFADACGSIPNPCEMATGTGGSGAGGAGGGPGTGGAGAGDGGVWGNCKEQDVQGQFDALVYDSLTGCASCHSDCDPNYSPKAIGCDPEFDTAGRWYDAYGDKQTTLLDMIGTAKMFDVNNVEKSEMVTKPIHQGEIFSPVINQTFVGVDHDGGQKLTPGGPQFQERFDDLVTFLDYFAGCHQ
jgi:hypothetical protein